MKLLERNPLEERQITRMALPSAESLVFVSEVPRVTLQETPLKILFVFLRLMVKSISITM